MIYLLLLFILFFLMLCYFKVADQFNIIDKPNKRSSHTEITIRGAGVIFYIAAIVYFFWSGFQYAYFFLGLTLISFISFLDDIFTLSNKLRVIVHFAAVALLCCQLNLSKGPWWVLLVAVIVVIGIINAYNFMDGINGMTAVYSLSVLFLLWKLNIEIGYIDERFLYCVALSNLVFGFFNFRIKAKCFGGDVGSVSMSFILIFALLCLILYTHNFIYILFLAVYGIDSVLTIVHRLWRKENIFEAHRSHLYQYLSNEAKGNRLLVASSYALLQLVIGIITIKMTNYSSNVQLLYITGILLLLGIIYAILRLFVLRTYVRVK